MIKSLLSPKWLAHLSSFNQLFVGYSGGLDSTVLLHVLTSHPPLRSKLIAVHVHHGISENASFWQAHCKQFCQTLGIQFMTEKVLFDCSANIEAGARIARYSVFSSLINEEDCLVLGHHLDDQAETVLLQLFRGAGVDGLSAMPEFGQLGLGKLARPFLTHSRDELKHYAEIMKLSWIEDESNEDMHYARNYLRHKIMPLVKKKWPGVVKNMSRTAMHCQQAKRNLEVLAAIDSSKEHNSSPHQIFVPHESSLLRREGENGLDLLKENDTQILFLDPLHEFNVDRLANILRAWLKTNQVQIPSTITIDRIIREVFHARKDATPQVSWDNVIIRRYHNYLFLVKQSENHLLSSTEWTTFPLSLSLNLEKAVESTTSAFSRLNNNSFFLLARKANQGVVLPSGVKIYVTFRQGGERFTWHGQTKRLKKLFQEWNVPPWLRDRVPLVYFDDILAVIVGYAMNDLFFTKESRDAWIFSTINA